MIRAALSQEAAALPQRLAARAAILARAAAQNIVRARRGNAWRWRKAELLWPGFSRGDR